MTHDTHGSQPPTETLSVVFDGRVHRAVDLSGAGCPAKALTDGLTILSAANGVAVNLLDHSGVQVRADVRNYAWHSLQLACMDGASRSAYQEQAALLLSHQHILFSSQDCKDSCMYDNLKSASSDIGLVLSALDLSAPEERLFSVELASIYAGVKAHLAAVKQQSDVQLLEISVLGLRGVVTKHGEDAPQANAARAALLQLLNWAVERLDAAYGGDVVYQASTAH